MKLLSLKLKGFIGLQKGLGLDEITLPLSSLNGLIAFDGPNGRGKTTVLENMQPFRQFASRRGGLKKHCFAKDSQKELTFEYNGDIIRTLIKMDAQTTRSDEGFIWVNDKPIVDGKVTSYDAAIKEIFGTPNLFFWSIFCAQNSKKLTDLTTGKLKELFTEFLRLDRYAAYEDTIKQAMSLITGIGQGINQDTEFFKKELQKLAEMNVDQIIETEGDNLQKSQKLLDQKLEEIDQLEKGIKDKAAEVAANQEKAKQRKALSLDLVAAKAELTDLEKEKAGKQTEIGDKLREVGSEIKKLLDKLENAQAIKQAADRCKDLDNTLRGITKDLEAQYQVRDNLQNDVNLLIAGVSTAEQAANEAEKRLAEVKAYTLEKDPEYTVMLAEIKGLEARSEALDQKDADCISEKCGLIVDALDASKKLPEAREIAEQYADGWKKGHKDSLKECIQVHDQAADNHVVALGKLKAAQDDLAPVKKDIERLNGEKGVFQKEFDDLSELASLAAELEIATAALSGFEGQEKDLKDALGKLELEYTEKFKAGQDKIDIIADRMAGIQIDENAEKDLEIMQTGLEAAKSTSDRIEKLIDQAEKKILEAGQVLKKVEEHQFGLDLAQSRFKKLAAESQDWLYLKEACGKKGLQALEIDGVSPVIEAYANDLLISTFGPMNTIRFETQDPDGKEVLNIVVMDPDGTETLLELKSGGEQVWILKALRLALTLLSKEKSGRNFQTVLMDEEDGALSPANAVRFINLYRSMMDLGGFETCYYISHKPEAVGLANHRLIFNENAIDID